MNITLIDLSAIFRAKWEAAASHHRDAPSEWTVTRVRELTPDNGVTIVCLDVGRSFRYDIFADYKANRPPKDEAMITQMARVQAMLQQLGYPLAGADTFEADDIIASLVAQAAEHEVCIVSRDKDLMQLVCERVWQRDPESGKEYGPAEVAQKFGVQPSQMGDLLALMGDTSDNIPGVRGVGVVNAARILAAHGDLDKLLAALAADEQGTLGAPIAGMTPKGAATLRASWSDVVLSRSLVTLRADAPVLLAGLLGSYVDDAMATLHLHPEHVRQASDAEEDAAEADDAPDPRGTFHEMGDSIREPARAEEDLTAALAASVAATAPQPRHYAAPRAPSRGESMSEAPMFDFQPANRESILLRLAIEGPTGAGKTYTSIGLACGIAKRLDLPAVNGVRVAVIDTERDSARKYAPSKTNGGGFKFAHCPLRTHEPDAFCRAIEAVERGGFGIVVLDSLSHAWMGVGGLLEQVDRIAAQSRSKSSFDAWRKGTPMQNKLIDTILNSKLHVIATMRSKMEYSADKGDDGKTKITKLGMAPVQRGDVEYEFDIVAEMDVSHGLSICKTRCASLDGYSVDRPGSDLADRISAWLTDSETTGAAA